MFFNFLYFYISGIFQIFDLLRNLVKKQNYFISFFNRILLALQAFFNFLYFSFKNPENISEIFLIFNFSQKFSNFSKEFFKFYKAFFDFISSSVKILQIFQESFGFLVFF